MTNPELSDRERQLLEHIALGRTNAAVGEQLFITADTVKTHLRRMYRKLGVHDRAHAVAVAYQRGLLTPAPAPPTPPTRTGPGAHPSIPPDARTVVLTVTEHDAEALRAAVWPDHPMPAVQRQRVLDGLRKLAGT